MDAEFIIRAGPLSQDQIDTAIRSARIPPIPEIAEQFERCSKRFLRTNT